MSFIVLDYYQGTSLPIQYCGAMNFILYFHIFV